MKSPGRTRRSRPEPAKGSESRKGRRPALPKSRRSRKATTARASHVRPRGAIIAGVAVLAAAVFHVWTGLRVAELGYQRSRAIELGQRLEAQRQGLLDELASLERIAFIEEEAARRLGLHPPSAGQVVDLRPKQLASSSLRGAP